jgi:hypothetical protein
LCIDRLQDELIEAGQIITYFRDVKSDHIAHQAIQYFGTKSFFTSYEANPDAPCTVADASMWLSMARALPGGAGLPALPATDRIAPAGVDIGPRKLAEEQPYRLYWAEKPELSRTMAVRWLDTACRSLGIEYDGRFGNGSGHAVTRGEFVTALYKLLLKRRRS